MAQTSIKLTSNQLHVTTDVSKIFVFDNRYVHLNFLYTNSTYDDVTVSAGTVLGQVKASAKTALYESGNADGTEIPFGVLGRDVIIAAGETFDAEVPICVRGDIPETKLAFQGSDDLTTLVGDRTVKSVLLDKVMLVESDELTEFDNQ